MAIVVDVKPACGGGEQACLLFGLVRKLLLELLMMLIARHPLDERPDLTHL